MSNSIRDFRHQLFGGRVDVGFAKDELIWINRIAEAGCMPPFFLC
ncbi:MULTISPECIES: hypothetical protein [Thermoactinomyces]|nr:MULTISPECIES: hypothetical protein [Thermoactinomyces]